MPQIYFIMLEAKRIGKNEVEWTGKSEIRKEGHEKSEIRQFKVVSQACKLYSDRFTLHWTKGNFGTVLC